MKKYFPLFIALFAIILVSCKDDNAIVEEKLVDVTVHLTSDGGLELTHEPISRASDKSPADAHMTNIDLKVFDNSGNVKKTISQVSTDQNFGTINCRIPAGTYQFVVVANSRSTAANISSATSATLPVVGGAVYSKVQSVTLSGNTSQTVNIEMGPRKNTTFRVKITDETPSNVEKLQLIVSPAKTAAASLTFNPATGFETTQKKYEVEVLKTQTPNGTFTNVLLSVNFMLTAATEQLDVTVNALSSSDQVLFTRTLTGVSLKQGEYTTATGTFFSALASGSFLFDTTMPDNPISLD